jgi:6-pyruvoyltetrahydropterin/6-carboxytetrahydropterin synthase
MRDHGASPPPAIGPTPARTDGPISLTSIIGPVVELSRTVRFCLNGPPTPGAAAAGASSDAPARHNTFAAWPPMLGLGRFYQVRVTCRGEADATTGYCLNIHAIDEAVRRHVLPYLTSLLADGASGAAVPLGRVMQRMLELLAPALAQRVTRLTLDLTPYLNLTIRSDDMAHVTLRHEYEFAAAHRLHVASMSDQENRATFGKCNNPSGHGHNYRLEVAVRVPIDPAGRVMTAERLDQIVDTHVIARLDHKHLNVDVPQFAGLNPSVENIAKVIYDLLASPVADTGAELDEVRVWETSKTVCTYRGEGGAGVEGDKARAAAGA